MPKSPNYIFVNIDISLEQSIWCVAEVVKPSTTASPYVELKYEWPIKGKQAQERIFVELESSNYKTNKFRINYE